MNVTTRPVCWQEQCDAITDEEEYPDLDERCEESSSRQHFLQNSYTCACAPVAIQAAYIAS